MSTENVLKNPISPAENLVVLRSTYGKVGIHCYIQPIKNSLGLYPKYVRRVNKDGDMILSDEDKQHINDPDFVVIPENHVFDVYDGIVFNLDIPQEAATWECIKDAPFIAPDRFAKDAQGNSLIDGTLDWESKQPRYGVAELYVDRPGVEAKKKVSRRKKIHDACTYIFEDEKGAEGRVLHAKLLGKRMNNVPDNEVTDYLLSVAEKNPEKIIELYTGTDMNLRLLFIDAKEKHVILLKNRLYIYADGVVLGATDDSVITWMKQAKNKKTLELIKRDTYPDFYIDEPDNKTK